MSEQPSDAVARRIRALLQKTVENGCTEDEAMAAAEKARELMDAYRLEQSDIEIQAEPVNDILLKRRNLHQVSSADYCAGAIGRYCGVRLWLQAGEKGRVLRCLGLKQDVEMAQYLYELIDRAIWYQADKVYYPTVKGGGRGRVRSLVWDFQIGMAHRLRDRLINMADARDQQAHTKTGTALVVVKNAVVTEAFAKLGIRLGRVKGRGVTDDGAYAAGFAAGDSVNLERPIGQDRPNGLLR